jgi:hypothetical protein
MKHIIKSALAATAVVAVLALTGCAHFAKTSTTTHELVKYGVTVPPGWHAITPTGSLGLPGTELATYADFEAAGTNAPSGLLANKPHTFVAYRESWIDRSKGGGTFVFTDPNASQVASGVVNQGALGGTHNFTVGDISSTITTNAVNAITAGGAAVGNVVGAALKTAAKP